MARPVLAKDKPSAFVAPLGTKVTHSGNCCREIADREAVGVSPLLPL